MRGNWIKHTATGGAGTLTLVAVSNFATFINVFGSSGTRVVEYEIDDGAGKFEAGIGSIALSTGVLTRSIPTATFSGTTYTNTAVSALTFSGTVNVRCSPLVSDAYPAANIVLDGLGDAIPSAGDPCGSGYAVATAALATGFIVGRPFIWRGSRPITKATMRCMTLSSGAKMLAGIYEPTAHDVLTLRLDLSNGGSGFDGGSTGNKTLTSGGGNFTETYLPIGEYALVFLQLTANASWQSYNCQNAYSAVLGTTAGIPITQMITAAGQTSLPTILGTGGTGISGSGNMYGGNNGFAIHFGW